MSLLLLAAVAMLALTGARVMTVFRFSSPTAFLLGVFVVAHAELLLVALGLSLFRQFAALQITITLLALLGLMLVATRHAPRRSGIDWRAAVSVVRSDQVLIALAVVAALGFAYTVALALGTPQVEDDVLGFHLVRAGLWRQHHGITYLHGIFDGRNNAYPPGGELGAATTMILAHNERFVALDQALSSLALAVGTVGIARRIGFAPRQALFGGILVVTLPVIVLQAGTALTDMVVAAFLLAAALFSIDGNRASPWLAGIAMALAMDVKLTAPLAVPLLLLLAWLAKPERLRRSRVIALCVGAVLGAFWYVVNLREKTHWHGGIAEPVHRDPAHVTARTVRTALDFIDVPGATGRDLWLYAVAAFVVLAVVVAIWLSRTGRRRILVTGLVAALLTLLPLALRPLAHGVIHAYFRTWTLLGRRDLAGLAPGHAVTRSAPNYSWFGPLGAVFFLGAPVIVIFAIRRRRLGSLVVVSALAPVYWCVAFSVAFFYQESAGRFFAFPMSLAAATWGILLNRRPVAWAATAVAATTLLLTLANDARQPSGLPLLERHKPRSVWLRPAASRTGPGYSPVIWFLDHRVPRSANIGLAITPADGVYPFFGSDLGHHVSFVYPQDRVAPGATWVVVRPDRRIALRAEDWRTAFTANGWHLLRRRAGR